jgi:hypothetical protein
MLNTPAVQSVIAALEPYIPVLRREGLKFAQDFIVLATQGGWVAAMESAWPKMTEQERDNASRVMLIEAQEAVDDAFESNVLAKEISLKLVYALMMMLLA